MNKSKEEAERILLVGHYGGSNIGDEAMLQSLLQTLPPSHTVSVVTKDPALGEHFEGRDIRVVSVGTRSVIRAVRSADIVLLGGGTHFHDDYRGIRLVRHYRYLARYIAVFAVAKVMRKRVYFIGVGVGPITRLSTKLLTRIALALADGITVRDRASLDEVATLGVEGKAVQAFDLAALGCRSALQTPLLRDVRCLAVSVTDIPGIDGNSLNREAVLKLIGSALLALLRALPDIRVKVVIARGGQRESDVEISEDLVDMLADYSERVRLVLYSPNPEVVFDEFRTCRAACVMRYHAGMLAYLAGCQLLLLPYHRKLTDLGQELGLSSSACPRMTRLDVAALTDLLLHLMKPQSIEFTATLPLSKARDMAQKNLAFLNT